MAATQVEDFKKLIPQPKSIEDQRLERVNEMTTRRKVERQLEKEALELWSTKPKEERMIRTGIFRVEEDRDKRDQFIKAYIDERFEERLLQEFRIKK